MAIKMLNQKKGMIKRLPHLSKGLAIKEIKLKSTVRSISKRLPEKGSITVKSSITFIKKVIVILSPNKKPKRKNNNYSSVDLTSCTSLSNSSNESEVNEFVTPATSPTNQNGNSKFFIEGSPSNVLEEVSKQKKSDEKSESMSLEDGMSDNTGKIESLEVVVPEKDIIQAEESSTTMKELFFEDDDTKIIFHFNRSNKWTIEIVEDNKKILPSSLKSYPKIQRIPIPSFYLKVALPEKVDMKQGKAYLKKVVSKDIERVRNSAGVVLELLVSIDSSVNFTSTLSNESVSRGLARVNLCTGI